MSFYLSINEVHPTGFEPAEFLDAPLLERLEQLSHTRTDGSPNGPGGRDHGADPAASTAPDPELSLLEDRSGRPGSKPNCDGSHLRVGFAPRAPAPSRP